MSGISFRELVPHDRLLCGVVVPRPIALVTTLDENGSVNAAPFSFFNVFSEDPPLDSSLRVWTDNGGCAMRRRTAARPTLRSSATATK